MRSEFQKQDWFAVLNLVLTWIGWAVVVVLVVEVVSYVKSVWW
jgi:hypothetical protein